MVKLQQSQKKRQSGSINAGNKKSWAETQPLYLHNETEN